MNLKRFFCFAACLSFFSSSAQENDNKMEQLFLSYQEAYRSCVDDLIEKAYPPGLSSSKLIDQIKEKCIKPLSETVKREDCSKICHDNLIEETDECNKRAEKEKRAGEKADALNKCTAEAQSQLGNCVETCDIDIKFKWFMSKLTPVEEKKIINSRWENVQPLIQEMEKKKEAYFQHIKKELEKKGYLEKPTDKEK